MQNMDWHNFSDWGSLTSIVGLFVSGWAAYQASNAAKAVKANMKSKDDFEVIKELAAQAKQVNAMINRRIGNSATGVGMSLEKDKTLLSGFCTDILSNISSFDKNHMKKVEDAAHDIQKQLKNFLQEETDEYMLCLELFSDKFVIINRALTETQSNLKFK